MNRVIRVSAVVLFAVVVTAYGGDAFAQVRTPRDKPLSVVFEPKDSAVLSAEVSAHVAAIHKRIGEDFPAGALLVELDPSLYKLNVEKMQSQAGPTSRILAITQRMRGYQAASSLEEESARKDASMARSGLSIAQKEMALCSINAPFAGLVKKVFVHENEWVDRGKPIIEIVNDQVLVANILLPSSAFGKVKIGQDVSITVNETGAVVTGKIARLSKVLDAASQTFEAYAEVPNAKGEVRGGMTGNLVANEGQ